MSGKIKVDSPLGKLLATKGITPANSNQFEGTANWVGSLHLGAGPGRDLESSLAGARRVVRSAAIAAAGHCCARRRRAVDVRRSETLRARRPDVRRTAVMVHIGMTSFGTWPST